MYPEYVFLYSFLCFIVYSSTNHWPSLCVSFHTFFILKLSIEKKRNKKFPSCNSLTQHTVSYILYSKYVHLLLHCLFCYWFACYLNLFFSLWPDCPWAKSWNFSLGKLYKCWENIISPAIPHWPWLSDHSFKFSTQWSNSLTMCWSRGPERLMILRNQSVVSKLFLQPNKLSVYGGVYVLSYFNTLQSNELVVFKKY